MERRTSAQRRLTARHPAAATGYATQSAADTVSEPGSSVVLERPPQGDKTTIATAIQSRFDSVWTNLGVDSLERMTPPCYQPGLGLQPGAARPDLELLVVTLSRGIYQPIAGDSRLGIDVADPRPRELHATAAPLLKYEHGVAIGDCSSVHRSGSPFSGSKAVE